MVQKCSTQSNPNFIHENLLSTYGYAVFLLGCSGNQPDNGEKHPSIESTPGTGNIAKHKRYCRGIKTRLHFHTVEIKQMKFVPAELTVNKGTP